MRTFILLTAVCAVLHAAKDKRLIPNEAGNENVDITATPLLDSAESKSAVGLELPAGIIAVRVKIAPKGDMAKLSISRDDFVLLSHKDGQRSGPYSPSQIAGSATMTVKRQIQGNGGMGSQRNSVPWGGIPGTGGRPRTMGGGRGGSSVGNTASSTETASATIKEGNESKDKENPLLKVLEEKMLPDKEITDSITGLLYFPLEGKVKSKELELIYTGPAGRLLIEFH